MYLQDRLEQRLQDIFQSEPDTFQLVLQLYIGGEQKNFTAIHIDIRTWNGGE